MIMVHTLPTVSQVVELFFPHQVVSRPSNPRKRNFSTPLLSTEGNTYIIRSLTEHRRSRATIGGWLAKEETDETLNLCCCSAAALPGDASGRGPDGPLRQRADQWRSRRLDNQFRLRSQRQLHLEFASHDRRV